jgi:hypothetical protein
MYALDLSGIRGRNQLKVSGIDGKIIYFLETWWKFVKWVYLRKSGVSGGLFGEYGNELLGPIKGGEFI